MQQAFADEYLLTINGPELNKISALKISLDIEPKEFCELEEGINISSKNIIFESVNKQGSFISILFNKQKEALSQINLHGKVKRNNYNGELTLKVKEIDYISRFAEELNSDLISSKIKIIKMCEIN